MSLPIYHQFVHSRYDVLHIKEMEARYPGVLADGGQRQVSSWSLESG